MIFKDNLQEILYKKYLENNLASLYLAKYDSNETDPEVWVNQFMSLITPIEDHPDVLKIHKTEKETEYKVDSIAIKNFLKFINYNPIKLNQRFIFLFDAQDLSVILNNKLLKIFEELGSNFCLILMVPDNAPMLATVESRAIKVQIPRSHFNKDNINSNNLFDFSGLQTPNDLLNFLKNTEDNPTLVEKKFIESTINSRLARARNSEKSYIDLDGLLSTLKSYETQSDFNNSKLARLTPFFL